MLNIRKIKHIVVTISCLLLVHTSAFAEENIPKDTASFIQLQTKSNHNFKAYVAGPKNAKQGLLLIHGWWGLNTEVKTWANKYAVSGYRVMAIDLYNEQTTSHPVKARKLISSVKQSIANEKYAAAIKSLTKPNRKVAIIGRSYGASQAIHAAMVAQEKISATIIYYPFDKVVIDSEKLSQIRSPIIGHFARNDYFFSLDKLNQFTKSIKNAGIPMLVKIYDAKHGFSNPIGKNFNEKAYLASLKSTNQFIQKYLD